MSGYFKYKFSLKLTSIGKTGMELSGSISEKAKDAILKAIMTDDRERICAKSIKETWDESQAKLKEQNGG